MTASPFIAEHHAKKSLGQHFLRDENVLRRLVALIDVHKGDHLIEIGPGPGALTALLRPLPWERLLLIEKDDSYAGGHAAHPLPGLEVWHGDALAFDWRGLTGAWKIIGNLPYNIASPLMWDIASTVCCLERAVFMVQKEVAERLLSPPGRKAYGALTAWIRNFCDVARGFDVPPCCFSPPPKVDSAVIVFTSRPYVRRPPHPDRLSFLLKLCFGQRRKQLHGILRSCFGESKTLMALQKTAIQGSLRPESLTPEQFAELSEHLFY